jgi:ABC-type oligopeptide transport system substrate-binding subunit
MLSHPEVMNRNYGWVGEQEYVNGEADEIVGIEIVDDHTVRFNMQEGRNNGNRIDSATNKSGLKLWKAGA